MREKTPKKASKLTQIFGRVNSSSAPTKETSGRDNSSSALNVLKGGVSDGHAISASAEILFYNFLESFSSIWSFLGHLWKKIEKNRNFLIFPKFRLRQIQTCFFLQKFRNVNSFPNKINTFGIKKIIFTIENRNFGFFQNGLSEKWAKKWRHYEKKSIFELQILFYNFLKSFSSIWSFLGHLCEKLEKTPEICSFSQNFDLETH